MNHLDEIRAKINIEDLVGGYVQLKKAGRNLKGLCPFHNDTRPSLMVSPEKGIAYCFACNNGGDIFKFIQLVEKVDFPEAVRILAERVGVKLPEFKPGLQDERATLFKIHEKAVDFFCEQLELHKEHKKYFYDRGLKEETIKQFKLGYAPDSYNALKDFLLKQNFNEKDILKSGLISQRTIADKNTYDRFRNRYIFPIFNYQGYPVGFGGRVIGDGEPKYLNSPDTPIFDKSFVLYGLNWAKPVIKELDLAIFVEGYMDVITAHQAGFKNVIATSGTAITEGKDSLRPADKAHLNLISRYTKNIAFAFDSDNAGIEATKRAIELARNYSLNIGIIQIPEGKDPDECIKNNPKEWQRAVENQITDFDFFLNYYFAKYDSNSIEGKKAILEEMLPFIRLYTTNVEQNEYLTRLAYKLKTDVKYLWEDMKKLGAKKTYQPAAETDGAVPQKEVFSREEFLLGFILDNPALYEIVHANLIDVAGFDPATEKIYKALKKVYNSSRSDGVEVRELQAELSEEERQRLSILPLLIEEYYPDFSEEAARKEVTSLIREINKKNLRISQKEFEFRIREAQDAGQRSLLLNQYSQILKLANKL